MPQITSCSQVAGFGSAAQIPFTTAFTQVGEPNNTFGFVHQKFENIPYLFELMSACTNNTTVSAVRSYYSTRLPSVGFAQSSKFPYKGDPSSACGDPYCWYQAPAHPVDQNGKYVSLESVKAVSATVVTFTLRLSIAPIARTITLHTGDEYGFDLVGSPDVQWQISGIVMENGAKAANLGVGPYGEEPLSDIRQANVKTNTIATSTLENSVLLAIHTNLGSWVKAQVENTSAVTSSSDLDLMYDLYTIWF